nr:Chain C, membrane glycoprotein E3 gp19K [unidentified]4J8G_D Chain D, membrane glycoprotein E3 gp19K [unidentified]
AASFIDAKKMP